MAAPEDTSPPDVTAARPAAAPAEVPAGAPPVAWAPVLAVVGVVLAVLLSFAGRYGAHRDELYFVSAGRRLAWGYPDQPALTPAIARLTDLVAPGSVAALHVPAALAAAAIVLLAALTARELGGRAAAQVLTAVLVAGAGATLLLGHLLSTATFDALAWVAVCLLALRALRRDEPRTWVWVGVVGGVGLENKHLIAFLLGAIVVGVALTPSVRHHLRSPWAWAGAAVAVALWVPNLLWQGSHGWPQLELAADIRAEYLTGEERVGFVLLLLVLMGPLVTAVWVYGLVRLWRVPELRSARPFAWAFVLLVAVFFLTGGKAYYLVGILPLLVAAGADGLARAWRTRALVVAGAVATVLAVLVMPLSLPVLPERDFAASPFVEIAEEQLEMIGWPAFVGTVQDVVDESGAVLVVTGNYGEAGALELVGSSVPVYSGHNGFGDWGPPTSDAGPVVVVGVGPEPPWAEGCEVAATVDTGVDNEEDGAAVLVCDGPRGGSWADVWDEVRHLDA